MLNSHKMVALNALQSLYKLQDARRTGDIDAAIRNCYDFTWQFLRCTIGDTSIRQVGTEISSPEATRGRVERWQVDEKINVNLRESRSIFREEKCGRVTRRGIRRTQRRLKKDHYISISRTTLYNHLANSRSVKR